jgi:polar amino acid transport system substrate-binding protein
MIEIAKKAFEKKGIAVEYITMPWDQAIEQTRAGRFTAIIGASKSDAPDFVFPEYEQGWMSNQFFIKKGNKWRYLGKDSLSSITLGVAAGYTYGSTIDNYIRLNKDNAQRVSISSGNNVLADNIEKLSSGKPMAILEDTHVMAYYLAQNKLSDKVTDAGRIPISDNNNLYVAFSPKEKSAKRYAQILSEETEALRASGELEKILTKYAVKDWRKQ